MNTELDPEYVRAQTVLREAGVAPADPTTVSLSEARTRQNSYFQFLAQDPPAVHEVRDIRIRGCHGEIALRLYYPTAERDLPVILFIRGAGWWAGNLNTHDRTARVCARSSGLPVCAVDYHCAPEARFPTQRDEVVTALHWLNRQSADVNIDGGTVILWGESAGASLAVLAASALAAGDATFIKGMILFYGNFEGPTEQTRAYSKWVWTQYLGGSWKNPDPDAIPLKVNPSLLPRAWFGVGDQDPLLRDTVLMSRALREGGVPCELKQYSGLPHGFITMTRIFRGASTAIEEAASYARAFAGVS